MEDKFVPLESEQDVILFDGNTYIIWNFKKIIAQGISHKFHTHLSDNRGEVLNSFQRIDNSQITFPTQKMTWHSCLKCQIIRVASPKWQSGELRVKADITFCETSETIGKSSKVYNTLDIKIFLEFCNEQIIEYESPLDDLRENIKT